MFSLKHKFIDLVEINFTCYFSVGNCISDRSLISPFGGGAYLGSMQGQLLGPCLRKGFPFTGKRGSILPGVGRGVTMEPGTVGQIAGKGGQVVAGPTK